MDSNYKSFFEFACCWLKQKGEFACRSVATLVVLFSLFATQSVANDLAGHEFLGWQNTESAIGTNSANHLLAFTTRCEVWVDCPKMWQGGGKPCDFKVPKLENIDDFKKLGGNISFNGNNCDKRKLRIYYSDEGGACSGWLKRMITIKYDGKVVRRCPVQWDFKKEDLKIKCPASMEMACKSQEEVDEKFKWWLKEYKVEGACGKYRVKTWPEDPQAPHACKGGEIEVKFIVKDECGREKWCKSTFKVNKPKPVDAWAPGEVWVEYCTPQKEVNKKFHKWLEAFGARGGCDLHYEIYVVEGTDQKPGEKPVAPSNCGGYVKVKISAYDNVCLKNGDEDYAVFHVKKAPELKLIEPGDKWLESCLSPEYVQKEFKAWLMSFRAEGGCATTASDLWGYKAPPACGGKVEVEFWAYDKCGQRKGIKRTFGVKRAPKLEYKCPTDYRIKACKNQDEVNEHFRKWLTGFMVRGGCAPKYPDVWKYKAPPACGGEVEIKFWISDRCSDEVGCNVTFTVEAAPQLVVNCPKDYTMRACASQDEVNDAFDKWLRKFKVEGGCNPRYPDLWKYKAPQACGGSVEVKFWVTDKCFPEDGCNRTFTVERAPKLIVHCAEDYKTEACLSQNKVNEIYYKWLQGFYAEAGCNPRYPSTKELLEKYPTPDNCGGKVTVDFWVRDRCNKEEGCQATFVVPRAPKLIVHCAEDYKTEPCLSQNKVNEIYYKWLAGFYAEAGCNPRYPSTKELLEKYPAPDNCGGKVTVDFWVRDRCNGEEGCQATFVVPRAPKLIVHCAEDYTTEACLKQEEINEMYIKWLKGFYAEEGCNPRYPTTRELLAKYPTPDKCGGKVTVDFWVRDRCNKETGCKATFAVPHAPRLMVKCAPEYTVPACSTQDEVDSAFKRWLTLFKVEGGCYPEVKFNQYEHPNACGSKTEVIFYAKDKCDQEAKCVAYFIVEKPEELKAVCPPTGKAEACLTQTEVDELFKAWLQGFKAEGGCNPKGKFYEYDEPKACGDKVEVTYYVYDECKNEDKCSAYFYVAKPEELKAICPPSYTMPACATQDDIDRDFKRWINFFRTEGGCEAISTPLDKYEAPKLCGGVVKIKFETRDRCGMYDYCESYFKVEEREAVKVYCPEDHTADADQTPAQVAAEWEAWLDKFVAKGPCKPLKVKYYLNGKEVASLDDLKKLVPDACGSDDQTVKVVAYDDCSKDYCEAKFNVEETFQRLILSLPDDQKLCHPGKYAPTKEDLPAPLTKEEVLVALKVPNCIQPVVPTFTIMVMGPEVTGDVYKFTRIYKVVAGPLSTESAEIIELVWDNEAPVFKGIPGTQMIPCGSEPPAWPKVSADDGYGRSLEITRKQEKSFILCGGVYWIRTWIAADECGNVARRTQKIYYQDEAPPVLEIPADTTIYCPGDIPEPTYEAYDDCSNVKVEYTESRKDQNSCEYTITRTWTAYDGCGKKTVKSQVITVIDDKAPVITPVNPMLVDMPIGGEMITYNCDAPAITMGDVEVYDECCSDFVVETNDELVSNATCDVFGYYRRWKCSVTATDDAGNSSEYYFYVLQYDTTAPEILNVPEDIELGCEDTIPAAPTDIEVSDDCSLEKVAEYREEVFFDPQDSSKYGIVRTWHSTDHCGNYGEDYQIIAKCGFDVSLINAKLGNSVWLDENGNGLQETEEPGIDGVTVYLHQVRVVGGETKTTKIDSTETTTIEGNAGQYEFDGLVRGTYQLQFTQPDGMEFTIPFAGVDATNSDVDPRTGFTEEIDLGFGQKRMEFDAGFLKGPLFDAAPLADFNYETNNEPVVEIDEISVFPNPTTALINVAMDIPEDGRVQLNIIDQLGQIVLSETRNLNRGKQTETIDLHAIPAGTYMLNVKMSDRSVTKMIIRN